MEILDAPAIAASQSSGPIKRSTKVLLLSGLVASLVMGIGYLNTQRLENIEQSIQRECGPAGLDGTNSRGSADTLCHAPALLALSGWGDTSPPYVVRAHIRTEDSRVWPVMAATAVFGLGLIYWLWYFVAQRAAEVGTTIDSRAARD
jgi:hypothetical protein